MTKRLKLLLSILLLLSVTGSLRWLLSPHQGPGHAAAVAARRKLERHDLQGAIGSWKQALLAEPGNGDYHGELGSAYLATEQHDLAIVHLQMAAYLQPQRPHVHCQLAQALVEERRREEALQALETALKGTPDCPLALSVKGEQLLRDDNLREALSAFERVIQLQPDFVLAYQKAGYALLSTSRYDEAVQVLKKGLEVSPHHPGIHALLGAAYAQRPSDPGAGELAEKHYLAAISNNPEAAKAHAALGQIYLRKNDLEAAREQYAQALSLQPYMGDALYGMAQVLRRQGKPNEAAKYLKLLDAGHKMERTIRDLQARAMAEPKNAQIRHRIAQECLRNGLVEEAGRALSEAVVIDPASREIREARSQWFLMTGAAERAAAEATIASRLPRSQQ